MEDTLNTEVRELHRVLKKKEEALESRDSEVNDLKSKIHVEIHYFPTRRSSDLDDQAMVASKAQHAEQVIEGLKANITMLEAKLRETEDTGHRKDVASQ